MRRALAVTALAVALAGSGCSESAQDRCDRLYGDRVGHDVNDDEFWEGLQTCAREQRLPAGANDPDLYA